MNARCSGCGAPIIWSRTVSGKAMPVDSAPAADGNLVLVETRNGPQAIVVKPGEFPKQERYRSHFSMCPEAAGFRKAKEKRT